MIDEFSFQHFRFHLEPKGTLQMPAFNKGSTLGPRRELSRTAHLGGQCDTGLSLMVWEVYLKKEGGVNDENL